MKKNPHSSDLAARLAAAASQPAGASTVPALVGAAPAIKEKERAPAPNSAHAEDEGTKPKDAATVPITLRPRGDLLNRFVLKAAERTREEGRVVSAQQIMIEALERSAP